MYTNAFIINITETDSAVEDEGEGFEEESENNLSFEQLKIQWKENLKVRAIQKEKIQNLMEENKQLLSVISSLKQKLREIQTEHDQTMKSVKMLNSGSKNLNHILNLGYSSSNKCGLDFNSSKKRISQANGIKFVPSTIDVKSDQPVETKAVSFS